MGSVTGALMIAPLGFGGITDESLSMVARAVFAILLAAAVVLLGLGVVWNRRWAI